MRREFTAVCVGFGKTDVEGGINEKGLFGDGFTAPYAPAVKSKDKPVYPGFLFDRIMTTCATVEEVINLLEPYNMKNFEYGMWMFADAEGHSIIIEGDQIVNGTGDY